MITRLPDDLRTGLRDIDAEHQEFLTRLASLDKAARKGNLLGATDTLRYVESYAAQHFSAEERRMADAAYPGLEAHRAKHQAFVAELDRRKAEYARNRSLVYLTVELGEWLGAWVQDHFRGEDAEMARYLRATCPEDLAVRLP